MQSKHKEFTIEEFNELINRLTDGLPVTMVLNRLTMALLAVLDEVPGSQGINALREFVRQKEN